MNSPSVGTEATYERDPLHPDALGPENVEPPKKFQYLGQKRTCVYNLPPSSPEMEAIYGPRKYNPKRAPNQAEELQKKLEAEIERNARLEAKLDVLLMQQVAKPVVAENATGYKTEPVGDKMVPTEDEPAPAPKGRRKK